MEPDVAYAGAGGAAGQGLLAGGIAARRSRVGRPLAAGGEDQILVLPVGGCLLYTSDAADE